MAEILDIINEKTNYKGECDECGGICSEEHEGYDTADSYTIKYEDGSERHLCYRCFITDSEVAN